MKFYLGTYFLIKLRDSSSLDNLRKYIYTPSTCINDSLLDNWSLSWVKTTSRDLREATEKFSINSEDVKEIQAWTGEAFNEEKIGWLNVFYDLETLKKYKKFFKNIDQNVKVLAIYLNEKEKDALIKEFRIEEKNTSSFGLDTLLSKQIEENDEGKTIGYDLIGVELSGDFHTFYCHNMARELEDKFGLRLNEYGLFEDYPDWEKITEFMNDDETGCEPVPWFYVKVKMFDV